MNIKINDIMKSKVITATPHETVETVRERMKKNKIHALPVVNPDQEPIGMVTSSDLVSDVSKTTPVSSIMAEKVYTVPQYSDVHIAARIMLNHHFHHLVVTHEKKLVGILSSFDLLKLVEDHRFVMKNPPTPKKNKSKRV